MPSPLFFILPLSPAHYRHLRHIVTNRLIIYVFCVTQCVTINSASHGGLTSAVKSVHHKAPLYGELSNEVRLRG